MSGPALASIAEKVERPEDETAPVVRWVEDVVEAVFEEPPAGGGRPADDGTRPAPAVGLALRGPVGRWRYLRADLEQESVEAIDVRTYLQMKERRVGGDKTPLEIDFGPFRREFPRLREAASIGRGAEFLNRHLSKALFDDQDHGFRRFINFLRLHTYKGRPLLLSERVRDLPELSESLRGALQLLGPMPGETPWREVAVRLAAFGFEPGWGAEVEGVRSHMGMLLDLLEAPDPQVLAVFLSRMPMVFSLAIISPHGFFGQANVLGLPDTGGQVVYILDQVRALEEEMRRRIRAFGLEGVEPDIVVLTRLIPEARGTTCDQRLEPIEGTRGARILRVPFRDGAGEVRRPWVSRFDLWPYLERFAEDSAAALMAELGGQRPDLIVGNYSDGNLVATLLSQSLGVTQCAIAHALEKTKYPNADVRWREHELSHRFSCQFTADLIAMNAADFVISSTYQEIAGTQEGEGQYESYRAFTLPGRYRVVEGVDVFDPKFNIVSPGAAPEHYFGFEESDRRPAELTGKARGMVFGDPGTAFRGALRHPERPIIFTMARLDQVKNITGLVDWFGRHPRLRDLANLVVVGGFLDPADSNDREEAVQIKKMHELFDSHRLDEVARWLPRCTDRQLGGELYRVVADNKGVFVQPARFEAFGLTVIEAMTSGLPTFATQNGGPSEIIVHGRSGFHLDPDRGDDAAESICAFFERVASEPDHWLSMSDAARARVEARYTWGRYARRMLDLSCLYGFWKYGTDLERRGTHRYLEMLYALGFRAWAGAPD